MKNIEPQDLAETLSQNSHLETWQATPQLRWRRRFENDTLQQKWINTEIGSEKWCDIEVVEFEEKENRQSPSLIQDSGWEIIYDKQSGDWLAHKAIPGHNGVLLCDKNYSNLLKRVKRYV